MTVSLAPDRGVDYAPCRYNGSRLWFRGPRQSLRTPYVACLGGSEVYGRYLAAPFTAELGDRINRTVVNLGVEHAGLDAFVNDPGCMTTAASAAVTLVQLTGAHNTSNRYYAVHPRRNDRFLRASGALKALYPEMDFTEVHFTRHLLERLNGICPDRFADIAQEIRQAWQARMRYLISQMNGKVVLFWFAPTSLTETSGEYLADCVVSEAVIAPLSPLVARLVEIVPENWQAGRTEMHIPKVEEVRAAELPGPVAHRQAATALSDIVAPMLA
ncbi:DUF6473 family protein [Marivita hallyeonensis]|uniref:DUF6473 domain-containing protein n=1 Tax=Marivita hallyeonensis TaxID=996342 RepID=A0A1M5WYF0_9RHOB|nr:DUF6473 family protein [Marivita hallyeonensis]SHH92706.1 hypothetical protein SAMN05443551_3608 [Marivita hallyeonensis]